jgi:uncharacterized protein YicC (UPF0701 family)
MTPARSSRHHTRRWLDHLCREVERWRVTLNTKANAADIIEGIMS